MSTEEHKKSALHGLIIGALGVVFGDIGTSPLYALRISLQTFSESPSSSEILGILSLMFWIIIAVVSLKYATFVMRADNRGEGGTFSLLALARRPRAVSQKQRRILVVIALIGASLFFGDGIITPAISVLSAVEGLQVAAPALHAFIIPIALLVLIGLFSVQRRGTEAIGLYFGPIMLLWFSALAVSGIASIIAAPIVLKALNPLYAAGFFADHPIGAFVTLGAVVLAVTGAEVLYTDMGHFGKKPIRFAWFGFVLPALVLNYFGQGALVLQSPSALENPFFLMQPGWAQLPMVALATMATIVASQAVISGAYSVCHQALQLGYLPRTKVLHTSATERGQIYLPTVNWFLLAGVIFLVLEFQSSSALGPAYGVAVTGDMLMTSVLMLFVTRYKWKWSLLKTGALIGTFLVIDLSLVSAVMPKIFNGGWFALMVGIFMFTIMSTWKTGRFLLYRKLQPLRLSMSEFVKSLTLSAPHRVQGTAVFPVAPGEDVPHALLHNLKHNQVLHERVVLLTIKVDDTPRVNPSDQYELKDYGENFYHLTAHIGFMEFPDVPKLLCDERAISPPCDPMETSFFLSRLRVIPSEEPGMVFWRERLFAAMVRNAGHVTDFFQIPHNRVVEFDLPVRI